MTFEQFLYTQPLLCFHSITSNLAAALENNLLYFMSFLTFPMLRENKFLLLCYSDEHNTDLKNFG